MKSYRVIIRIIIVWVLAVVVVLSLYFTHKDQIDVDWIRAVVHDNRFLIIPFYLLLLSCLGLTFIPSTPFAIAGVAFGKMLPANKKLKVLGINPLLLSPTSGRA